MNSKPETYQEKLLWYATAPRATSGALHSIEGNEIRKRYGGKLRGKFVSLSGEEFRKSTREDAVDLARRFRQICIDEARQAGLM